MEPVMTPTDHERNQEQRINTRRNHSAVHKALSGLVVAVALVGTLFALSGHSTSKPNEESSQPVAFTPAKSSTTTTTLVSPVVPVSLPTPQVPPEDPYAPEPHVVLGRIEIPKIGIDMALNQGISLRSIDRGPSHWPGTALPGEPGNVVIAGHRVSKTRPFRNIDQLVPGDEVIFTVEEKRSVYVVTGSQVVTPDAMEIVNQTPESTATLFACHPPGSARYRYVVFLAFGPEGSSQNSTSPPVSAAGL